MSAIPHLKMQSPDGVATNVAAIRQLFPNCVTETLDDATGELKYAVDFDQLRQELSGDIVEGPKERYQLTWPGKRKAILTANAPIRKTLRPAREESVDFDTTQNLFIEGDNLDALKLLQETYLGKVKMIYIDPPYNTGKDFVYKDDFKQSTAEYLEASGQRDEEGNRLELNSDSNGRYHSDWLTMMYSRLKIARNLLREDGVIFVSIDNHEVHNTLSIVRELFGRLSFKNIISVRRGIKNVQAQFEAISNLSQGHEYILMFAKSHNAKLPQLIKLHDTIKAGKWDTFWRGTDRPTMRYELFDQLPNTGQWRWKKEKAYLSIKNYETFLKSGVEEIDHYYNDTLTSSGVKLSFVRLNSDNVIQYYVPPKGGKLLSDNWMDISIAGNAQAGFETEKNAAILVRAIGWITEVSEHDIILDFFAGSATTGHAVMKLNAEDGGNRKYVCVQLPETTPDKSEARKAGYDTIADIAKERLRRAGKKIKEEHPDWKGDTGFRVLKVDTTSMQDVYYSPSETQQAELLGLVDNIKQDRSAEDLLFQVMLDMGVPLDLPIERKTVEGTEVFVVGHNDLVACFAERLTEDAVKAIAKLQPMRVVLKDKAFTSDSAKINAEQVRKHFAPESELRVL